MDLICFVLTIFGLAVITKPGDAQIREPLNNSSDNRPSSFNCLFRSHAFHCTSGYCIAPERVRDGVADCPDASDESESIDLCDYAPYFPDYRCSVYANCINVRDGYSCRCQAGYVGPGEQCQPAPLNLQRFLTTPRSLLIQTMRETNSRTQAGRSIKDLSDEMLTKNQIKFSANSAFPNYIWGTFNRSGNRVVNTRELHNITQSPNVPLANSIGVTLPQNEQVVCPNKSIIVNESGQVWCLKIVNGNIEYPANYKSTKSPAATNVFQAEPAKFPTKGSFGSWNFADPEDVFRSVTTKRLTIPKNTGDSNHVTSGSEQQPVYVTKEGASYGFLPAAPTSKLPAYSPQPSMSGGQVAVGTIITPVKIWNATGGALTAYRITPNATLPASCLTGSRKMFLCASNDFCVTPDKILNGVDDCPDGSDEVPEFIDECAFGSDWPQYKCGDLASCTDTEKGYTCTCFPGYYWNETTCIPIPVSPSVNFPFNSGNPFISAVMTPFGNLGIPTSNPAVAAQPDERYPNTVAFISHPGSASWTVYSTINSSWSSAKGSGVLQTTPLLRLPNIKCPNCLPPIMVTLGPVGLGQQERTSNQNQSMGSQYSSGLLQSASGTESPFMPAVFGYGQTGSTSQTAASVPQISATMRAPSAVTIMQGFSESATAIQSSTKPTNVFRFDSSGNAITAMTILSPPQSQKPTGTTIIQGSSGVGGVTHSSSMVTPSSNVEASGDGDLLAELLRTASPILPIASVTIRGTLLPSGETVTEILSEPGPATQSSVFGSEDLGNSSQNSASDWPAVLEALRRLSSQTKAATAYTNSSVSGKYGDFHSFTNNNQAFGVGIYNSTMLSVSPVAAFSSPIMSISQQVIQTVTQSSNVSDFATPISEGITATSASVVSSSSTQSNSNRSIILGALVDSSVEEVSNQDTSSPLYNIVTSTGGPLSIVTLPTGVFTTASQTDQTSRAETDFYTIHQSQRSTTTQSKIVVVTSQPSNDSTAQTEAQDNNTTVTPRMLNMTGLVSQATDSADTTTIPSALAILLAGTNDRQQMGFVRPSTSTGGLSNFSTDHGNNNTTVSFFTQMSVQGNLDSQMNASNLLSPNGPPNLSVHITPSSRESDEQVDSTSTITHSTVTPTAASSTFWTLPFITDTITTTVTPPVSWTLPPISNANPSTIDLGAFPINRLWDTSKKSFLPVSSSLGNSTLSPVNPAPVALADQYDCFGDLFKKGYSKLQNEHKTCNQGCVGKNEICISPDGRCDCVPGTARVNATGECEPGFQYNIGLTLSELCGKPLEFQPYLSDVNNPASQELAVVVCHQIGELIAKTSLASSYDPASCNPIGFSQGSVIANMALSFRTSNQSDPQTVPFDLVKLLRAVLEKNDGVLVSGDPNALRVKPNPSSDTDVNKTYTVTIGDINECQLNLHACDINADCRNTFGSFSCLCHTGFLNRNPGLPGRDCDLVNVTLIADNSTAPFCTADYYRFGHLCLYPAYYILLMIAFVIAGILALIILGCLIAACCRCCNRKTIEFDPPQAALIRAAARSPRSLEHSNTTTYQVLKSAGQSPVLDPNAPRAPRAAAPPNSDVEKGGFRTSQNEQVNEDALVDKLNNKDKVETWEEVEVPSFPQRNDDELVKRALSPSQEPAAPQIPNLGNVTQETVIEAAAEAPEQGPEQPKLIRTHDTLSVHSIGSAGDLARTDYSLPTSPPTSLKQLVSAKEVAKKVHLEVQNSIRKASAETRDWLAMPRTESLVMDDDLDIDTLPEKVYDKEPIFELANAAPNTQTDLNEKDLRQMGIGLRDSFDDVMDQTTRFYPPSSSDNEYDKEDDLSVDNKNPVVTHNLRTSTNNVPEEEIADQPAFQRPPAFLIVPKGIPDDVSLDEADLDNLKMSTDPAVAEEPVEDDQLSLKSADEEELTNLRGSVSSLHSLKNKTDSHDDVIDQIVEEQPVFYSPTNDSDEETYHKRSSAFRNEIVDGAQNSMLDALRSTERKTSAIQREIAINEFGALGERDSFDELIDNTRAFFSRASTLDSFQLQKGESGDEPESAVGSRKTSQSLLGSDLNNAPGSVEASPRRRTLLKKRSAFYSRDSMNKIIETAGTTDESGTETETGLRGADQENAEIQAQPRRSSIFEFQDVHKASTHSGTGERNIALDDSDINAFFSAPEVPAENQTIEEHPMETADHDEAEMKTELIPRTEQLQENGKPESVDRESSLRRANTTDEEGTKPVPEDEDKQRPQSSDSKRTRSAVQPLLSELKIGGLKSPKSVSDQNLQDGEGVQAIIPHDSDSGVYVDTTHADGSNGSRRRNVTSSQDDLHVFEGQEARREGSGSSYQRMSQSDDEEEVMKRYSTAYESKVRKTKRIRHNYEMGPPESRHVYYSSRPKRMPPSRNDLESYDSTWWRVRK